MSIPLPSRLPSPSDQVAGSSVRSALAPADPIQILINAHLSGKSPRTLSAYRRDLSDFQRYLGVSQPDEAVRALLSDTAGNANVLALGYRADMMQHTLQPATINRRIAALRSLVKLANMLGVVPWRMEIPGVKSTPYRDTRGPGRNVFESMLEAIQNELHTSRQSKAVKQKALTNRRRKLLRDYAILRLLHDLGLRRGEVCSLDHADLDMQGRRLLVLGKGRLEKVWLTLPVQTANALSEWLSARGDAPGILFWNYDRAGKGDGRLTGSAIYDIVRRYGRQVGVTVRPHGLRHLAITTALDRTGGNFRAVQKFSRHRDIRVLTYYDDNRSDLGGEVASLIAG